MENQKNEITKTIRTYVEGYLNAERGLVAKAFYSETRLYSVDEGRIDKTEMKDWLTNLDDRKAKQDLRSASFEIGFIDVTSDAAVAKVTLEFEKRRFVDYLSLLNVDQRWIIVGKIYTLQVN